LVRAASVHDLGPISVQFVVAGGLPLKAVPYDEARSGGPHLRLDLRLAIDAMMTRPFGSCPHLPDRRLCSARALLRGRAASARGDPRWRLHLQPLRRGRPAPTRSVVGCQPTLPRIPRRPCQPFLTAYFVQRRSPSLVILPASINSRSFVVRPEGVVPASGVKTRGTPGWRDAHPCVGRRAGPSRDHLVVEPASCRIRTAAAAATLASTGTGDPRMRCSHPAASSRLHTTRRNPLSESSMTILSDVVTGAQTPRERMSCGTRARGLARTLSLIRGGDCSARASRGAIAATSA
jgi:hypothetical protein